MNSKAPIATLIALASLSGCTSEKEKEDKGGETFEKMVILEEDPSGLDIADDRKNDFKIR